MKILFDVEEMKIGCVLLQAIHGGDNKFAAQIDPKHWFLVPTPDMKLYDINPDQAKQLMYKLDQTR